MAIYKLIPSLKEYIWGGEKLKEYRTTNLNSIAESWELSFHESGLSCVNIEGEIIPLCDVVSKEELGENVKQFPFFPVLIKLIDAKENLSIQVSCEGSRCSGTAWSPPGSVVLHRCIGTSCLGE